MDGQKNLTILEDQKQININPETLLSKAIDKGLPVETMEKLLKMREDLKKEWAKEQYFFALSNFQLICPVINKDAKVNFKSERTGKTTNYKYATLDTIITQVKQHLKNNGFSYMIKTIQDQNSVTAICVTYHIAGHSEETNFTIPIDKTAYMNDAQKVASALTYAKRYAFCNAFGIMTGDEDDDSNNTQKIEDNDQKSGTENITQLPEQNKAIYQQIMVVLNGRHNKVDLFKNQEKLDYVKNANVIKNDLTKLKDFHETLEGLAMRRVKELGNGGQK